MMCEECGVRPANIHLTTITNGEKSEKNLCLVCMAKYHKLPGMDLPGLNTVLNNVIGMKKPGEEPADNAQDEVYPDMICRDCGMTYEEFRKGGRLGCANCYTAFREPIGRLLTKLNGNARYTGKLPEAGKGGIPLRISLENLKKRLAKAIEEEEYEEAALLRDKIRTITHQLEMGGTENEQ